MIQKLKSIKTWLLIWIVVALSYIIFTNKNDFLPLAQILAVAVTAYFGVNVAQKKIFADKDKVNEDKGRP